jgi:GNAT superfamily N-acetyltransferase
VAFAAIQNNPAQTLVVVEASEVLVGTLQLTFVRTLSRRGGLRAQLEALRVRSDCRGSGLGQAMVRWAIDEARRQGCSVVELTSDKRRTEAHRFYAHLGFVASHEGFKLRLD